MATIAVDMNVCVHYALCIDRNTDCTVAPAYSGSMGNACRALAHYLKLKRAFVHSMCFDWLIEYIVDGTSGSN